MNRHILLTLAAFVSLMNQFSFATKYREIEDGKVVYSYWNAKEYQKKIEQVKVAAVEMDYYTKNNNKRNKKQIYQDRYAKLRAMHLAQ